MPDRSFLFAWLAYLVVTFAMGYIWHLKLFKDLYDRLGIFTRLDDPIVPLGFLAMVIQGGLLAFVYPLIRGGGGVVTEGLHFGLLAGVFIASSAVIAEAAKQRVTSLGTWLAVESLYYLLQFGLCGLAIAAVYAM